MNGIYNFEKYKAPYLDEQMLIARKNKKEKQKLFILSLLASVTMMIMMIIGFTRAYEVNQGELEIYVKAYIIYLIFTSIIVGILLNRCRKGREDKERCQL